MKTFGLIGYPLSHSFSHKYFSEKFEKESIANAEYKLFPMKNINEFPALINSSTQLCGLNVTIPHKESIIPFLDKLDKTAEEIGAVNCISIRYMKNKSKQLTGYNTDAFGFEQSLKRLLKSYHRKALILGTGGASKAVQYILTILKIEFLLVSGKAGSLAISYSGINKEIMTDHKLIINTTPLGMFPNEHECPLLPYHLLTRKHLLFDLIYNPDETLFLQKGKEKGAMIKNGMEMLELQAEKSWNIWNL